MPNNYADELFQAIFHLSYTPKLAVVAAAVVMQARRDNVANVFILFIMDEIIKVVGQASKSPIRKDSNFMMQRNQKLSKFCHQQKQSCMQHCA